MNNNRNSVQLANHIIWGGDNSEINDVDGMKIETIQHNVPFESFKDKIINYIISIYKNGGDMKLIFKKVENSINAMTIKHKPRPLANTTDQIEKDIQRKRVKKFVSREFMLRSYMEKL